MLPSPEIGEEIMAEVTLRYSLWFIAVSCPRERGFLLSRLSDEGSVPVVAKWTAVFVCGCAETQEGKRHT